MPPFFPRSEHDLYTMPVEKLLAHLRAARASGDASQAALAQAMLAHREQRWVLMRVRLACPSAPDWVHEEIAGNVFEDAMSGAWRGERHGSFRAWTKEIVGGRVKDFFRTRKAEAALTQRSLEGPEGDDLLERLHTDGEELADALDRSLRLDGARVVLERLRERNPMHAAVVVGAVWEDRPSREVAEDQATTAANVDQISARYRRALERFFEEEA